MALKHLLPLLAIALAAACGESAPPAEEPGSEPDAISVTRWTEKTELFAEYPPLAAGAPSRFGIHLTRLETFSPLTEGRVAVHLRGGGAPDETFRVDSPSRPGIFGVDVKPAHAGRRELTIELRAPGLDDQHRVGDVTVHPADGRAGASTGEGDAHDGISFLKEQQWALDFGTAAVREAALRESIRVPARIEARPDGAADVVAPIDGRLTQVVDAPLGTRVDRGQVLARLIPPPAVPADLPRLQRDKTEAEYGLSLATADRERAERLTAAGAAPRKRLDEARAAEAQAGARLAAAAETLARYEAARLGGTEGADGLFAIRAPLTGAIAEREAAAGANVTAGALLFRIVDTTRVHVVGRVPEADAAAAQRASGAELEIPARQERVAVGPLAGVGKVLDAGSRTLPITFAFDNRTLALPVGQAVFLHLLMEAAPSRPVVPAAAVVDDAGQPIVFVQLGGETFERRAVTVGPRSGDRVQIVAGVRPGERVVTEGAYLVRLASLSTSVPAHGHAH